MVENKYNNNPTTLAELADAMERGEYIEFHSSVIAAMERAHERINARKAREALMAPEELEADKARWIREVAEEMTEWGTAYDSQFH